MESQANSSLDLGSKPPKQHGHVKALKAAFGS
jgi:hypothetical protein